MLADVRLPFFPSTTNCLAWSKDGELAIAAGEYVHILIPNRRRRQEKKQDRALDAWIRVHFRVNVFATEEWPIQEPAAFEEFSIGEEQSLSIVTKLFWSTPGLAKHRRSVLAVLTTNLVLSLWESTSDQAKPSSWQRVLIINNVIEKTLLEQVGSDINLRKRKRIRSAEWANTLTFGQIERELATKTQAKPELLKIVNDFSEIIFLQIRSPYDAQISYDSEWQAEVSWIRSNSTLIPREPAKSTLWIDESEKGWFALLCGKHDALEVTLYPTAEVGLENPRKSLRVSRAALSHPIDRWESNSEDATRPRIHPWDQITGMTLIRSPPSSNGLLYLTTHLSHIEVFRYSNHIGPESILRGRVLTPSDGSCFLQKQISKHRKNFATKHNLGRMTITKTWGLASLSNLIATCITLHPSDQVEYRLPKEEEAFMVFASASSDNISYPTISSGPDIFFPWEAEKECKPVPDAYEAIFSLEFTWPSKTIAMEDCMSRRLFYNSICAATIILAMRKEDVPSQEWRERIIPRIHLQEKVFASLNRIMPMIGNLPRDPADLPPLIKELNDCIRAQSIREATWPPQRRYTETCTIPGCRSALLWETLLMARCMAGHRWRRCTLTFSAIQMPGVSKYCEKCGREYLDDEKIFPIIIPAKRDEVDASEGSSTSGESLKPQPRTGGREFTLARQVFKTFDVCIFCEGKFIS